MNETIAYIKDVLRNHFQPEEIRSLTRLIMKEVCAFEPHHIHLYKDKDLSDEKKEEIRAITGRLLKDEPIQYILGKTIFYGLAFRLSPSVLIPRPETEELVDLIIREEKDQGLHVLDIGTGSGCIAVSLAKFLAGADVSAIDISEEALGIARENAEANQARVRFLHTDILNITNFPAGRLDLIVSNPPYVINSERKDMKPNVVAYEPHEALFVPDNDPLLFYRAIAKFGSKHLEKGGRVYFEINTALGEEATRLLEDEGYRDCILIKDLSGRDRIIKAIY